MGEAKKANRESFRRVRRGHSPEYSARLVGEVVAETAGLNDDPATWPSAATMWLNAASVALFVGAGMTALAVIGAAVGHLIHRRPRGR
jgi:hypothetical protein